MIAVFVGAAVIMGVRTYVMQWLGNRVLFDLRVRVYNHLQMLPINYYNQRQTGQIMSRVTSDLVRLQAFITSGFQQILVNLVTMLLIAGILLALDWRAVPGRPGAGALHRGQHVHLRPPRPHALPPHLAAAGRAAGRPGGHHPRHPRREGLRPGAAGEQPLQQPERRAAASSRCALCASPAAFFPFLGLMTGLGSILIFGVGGWMVLATTVSLGTLIAFMQYLWQFYMPVQSFGDINDQLQRCMTERRARLRGARRQTPSRWTARASVLKPVTGRIEFRNVRFSYEPGKYACSTTSASPSSRAR